jgi:acetolactate synthase small subunit
MAKAKEFTVAIADKPGALGKCFLALAKRGVNILAYQSYVEERESLVRAVGASPGRSIEAGFRTRKVGFICGEMGGGG